MHHVPRFVRNRLQSPETLMLPEFFYYVLDQWWHRPGAAVVFFRLLFEASA
jgi:hypothetical protein